VNIFYTYTWFRKDDSPYYIGKGKDSRAFDSYLGHRPPKDLSRIQVQYWPDEATALAYEMYQIDFWGRKDNGTGILRNLTDGGDGNRGWSEEARVTTSKRFKGKTYEELYGKKKAQELREKRSKQWKGKSKPVNQRKKMSVAAEGKTKAYLIWNTGLTKETDSRLAAQGIAQSQRMKGRSYEDLYGIEGAEKRRKLQSETIKGTKRQGGIGRGRKGSKMIRIG